MAVCPSVEIWNSFQQHPALTVGAQRRPIPEPDLRHRLGGSKRNYGDANRRRPTNREPHVPTHTASFDSRRESPKPRPRPRCSRPCSLRS